MSRELRQYALTDAETERAALYRMLRQLEATGNLVSIWDADGSSPPRRVYRLTAGGERHLQEWATVLAQVAGSLSRFVREAQALDEVATGSVPGQRHASRC